MFDPLDRLFGMLKPRLRGSETPRRQADTDADGLNAALNALHELAEASTDLILRDLDDVLSNGDLSDAATDPPASGADARRDGVIRAMRAYGNALELLRRNGRVHF